MRKQIKTLVATAVVVLSFALAAVAAPWGTHYHNWVAMVDNCTTHGYVSDGAQKRHRVEIVTLRGNPVVGCDLRARFQSYIQAKQIWVTVDTDMHYYPFG